MKVVHLQKYCSEQKKNEREKKNFKVWMLYGIPFRAFKIRAKVRFEFTASPPPPPTRFHPDLDHSGPSRVVDDADLPSSITLTHLQSPDPQTRPDP